jgi:hypothetical protein
MKRLIAALVVVAVLGTAAPSHAYVLIVWDIVAWAKHYATKKLQEAVNESQQKLNEKLYIVNRRLASWTDVEPYGMTRDDTPPFKIFDWFSDVVLFVRPLHHTLSYGNDPDGAAWAEVSIPRDDSADAMGEGLSPEADAYLRARLSSLDLADAILVRASDASGALRFAGRAEDDALTLLQTEVLDDDQEAAMNAIISKLMAQSLIESRNAQSALTLQTALVELLAIDGKRDREAHTEALNAQLKALAQERDPSLDGTADVLANWGR